MPRVKTHVVYVGGSQEYGNTHTHTHTHRHTHAQTNHVYSSQDH